ncbi:hypothetical protein QUG98_04350 [Curtobacterium sp. RHCJP20]|uniref:Transposase n=1 Tax=Curtobacterium subtropicum TaxID=3055138 RepID=A0ABT7TDM6_9MICO|nr:hypothetical protein [Curtobacterium subtropicum]MDM7887679.1 hypothetical protein [Curtobacterium subtropicum]
MSVRPKNHGEWHFAYFPADQGSPGTGGEQRCDRRVPDLAGVSPYRGRNIRLGQPPQAPTPLHRIPSDPAITDRVIDPRLTDADNPNKSSCMAVIDNQKPGATTVAMRRMLRKRSHRPPPQKTVDAPAVADRHKARPHSGRIDRSNTQTEVRANTTTPQPGRFLVVRSGCPSLKRGTVCGANTIRSQHEALRTKGHLESFPFRRISYAATTPSSSTADRPARTAQPNWLRDAKRVSRPRGRQLLRHHIRLGRCRPAHQVQGPHVGSQNRGACDLHAGAIASLRGQRDRAQAQQRRRAPEPADFAYDLN